QSRASEVNRALAQAGIYASGIDTGSDLEALFLELTGGEPAGEGRALFFGAAGAGPTGAGAGAAGAAGAGPAGASPAASGPEVKR
ncbi:MAG: hypothetical protein M3067_00375, partial [Chloroflexota bacterium]|nr:hypothetical protein [Chloroflexota bacterium]